MYMGDVEWGVGSMPDSRSKLDFGRPRGSEYIPDGVLEAILIRGEAST